MKRIYLYLFLFSFVINIFQYMNDSKILKAQNEKINRLEKQLKKTQDSLSINLKSKKI